MYLNDTNDEPLGDRTLFTVLGLLNTLSTTIARNAGVLVSTRTGRFTIDKKKLPMMLELLDAGLTTCAIPDCWAVEYFKTHWHRAYRDKLKLREARAICISWGLFDRDKGQFDPRPKNRSRYSPPYRNIRFREILRYYEAIEQELIDRGYTLEEDFPQHKGGNTVALFNAVFPTPFRRQPIEKEELGLTEAIVPVENPQTKISQPVSEEDAEAIEENDRWFVSTYGYSLWWLWVRSYATGEILCDGAAAPTIDWQAEHLLDLIEMRYGGQVTEAQLQQRRLHAQRFLADRNTAKVRART